MPFHRVALVFDDRPRPDTTGVHCLRALAGLVEAVHFRPDRRDEIPAEGFDLYLSVDDDTDHRLPDRLRPLAYWAIDTHLGFDARLERALRADLVVSAQRDGAEKLAAAGVAAEWLPLACDPDVHRRLEVPEAFDFGFVGHEFPGPRAELLDLLRRRYPRHFAGTAYGDELARVYSASRIAFNRSLRGDVNMRVFEAMACGALLITDDLAGNGLAELFRDGEHLATYRDADELIEKVDYYLAHEEERRTIAAAGRAEVLARHTYRHRMERLLALAEGLPKRSAGAASRPRAVTMPVPGATAGPGEPALASIIVPCFNQLEFTRHCVRALCRHTRTPWELIVVDNGSTDGTAAYLGGVQDACPAPVTVVTNPRNLGFPAAVNQGLRVARGEFLVLLNNDAVVTDGWLDQLVGTHIRGHPYITR